MLRADTDVKSYFPAVARAQRLIGTGQVRALVDIIGGPVIKTCPLYEPAEPNQIKSLVNAAMAMVTKWKCRPSIRIPSIP
jgi:hypothetical protein